MKTKGAIVSAPGGKPNSLIVLSYQGKRPHLVEPRKGGAFSCDADCTNWKGMGICSHCVVVAEFCKKLPEFVEQFKKVRKF